MPEVAPSEFCLFESETSGAIIREREIGLYRKKLSNDLSRIGLASRCSEPSRKKTQICCKLRIFTCAYPRPLDRIVVVGADIVREAQYTVEIETASV